MESALDKDGDDFKKAMEECEKLGKELETKYKDKTADQEKAAKAGEECMKPLEEKIMKKALEGLKK